MASSLFRNDGRTCLVTGGSRGLGLAAARAIASSGARVLIAARNVDQLALAATEIGSDAEQEPLWVQADLSTRAGQEELAGRARELLGRVDILVSNAGSYVAEPLSEGSDETWDRLLELNLSASMRLARSFLPDMVALRWGRVINISSILALGSRAGASAYSATKSALIGFTKAAALEVGSAGVTVNCIAPGAFNTHDPAATPTERQKANFASSTALARWGRPEELAGPILLLASDAGSYITGTVLIVDGGARCRILY